jgi:hypothetical protein
MPEGSGRTGDDIRRQMELERAIRQGGTAAEFLQSYTTQPASGPGARDVPLSRPSYSPPASSSNIPISEFDDYDSMMESWDPSSTDEMEGRYIQSQENQNRSRPRAQFINGPTPPFPTQNPSREGSSNISFGNKVSSARAYAQDPLRTKQNLLSETLARFAGMPEFDRARAVDIASDVFLQAKQDNFGHTSPQGLWRRATNYDSNQAAAEFISRKGNFLNPFSNTNLDTKQDSLERISEPGNTFISKGLKNVGNALENIRYPDFISNALSLRNPLVEAGGPISEGSFVNPQAIKFLKEFQPINNNRRASYASPYGTSVGVGKSNDERYAGVRHDLAFTGPFGYRQGKDIRKEIADYSRIADRLESEGNFERAAVLRDEAINKQEMLNEPLRGPALRYTLGTALENIPVGSTLTAAPIGGERGARSRIYSSLTSGALAADKDTGKIESVRQSPTEWTNVGTGKSAIFDPGSLKDPMIRATYNLPEGADVSQLRSEPLGLFKRVDRTDWTKPVITTESPIYKVRQGIKGATSVGLADLIPSREAVKDFYGGRPLQGVERMAGNFASGIPAAVATGAVVSAAPGIAPFVPGVGWGLTAVAAANALDEVSRQQTKEGLLSKFRQTIGTAPRTGYANPNFKTTVQTTTPQITALTPQQKQTMAQNQNRNELQRRVDLFKQRFNPSRGEFGFSEMLFGR